MLDGFNERVVFEHGEAGSLKAATTLQSVLRDLSNAPPDHERTMP
ncbi:MAG TPA: hypothetical protein VFG49_14560 [Dyella sp.]|nr:hypothetical protein [Dyella sp.]